MRPLRPAKASREVGNARFDPLLFSRRQSAATERRGGERRGRGQTRADVKDDSRATRATRTRRLTRRARRGRAVRRDANDSLLTRHPRGRKRKRVFATKRVERGAGIGWRSTSGRLTTCAREETRRGRTCAERVRDIPTPVERTKQWTATASRGLERIWKKFQKCDRAFPAGSTRRDVARRKSRNSRQTRSKTPRYF